MPSRFCDVAGTPALTIACVAECSCGTVSRRPPRKRIIIAAKIAQPSRILPTIFPKVYVRAAGIPRISSSSRKFASAVPPSKGCAELTLKKPPPFVPSCLIAICEATGPRAIVCAKPWTPVTVAEFANVCTTPWVIRMTATTIEIGSRM